MIQQKTAIIVAGGSGERMQSAVPKQFLPLNGKPILMHTLERFYEYSPQMALVLVLPAGQIAYWETLCTEHRFALRHKVVAGGATRFFSVKNALEAIGRGEGLIAVHDGVRPLVDTSTVERCFRAAARFGAAIPAIELTDSIRQINGSSSIAADRRLYKRVQTPQVFCAEMLFKSYEQPFGDRFTDDASVVEAAGYAVTLVDGHNDNIKITTPTDLTLAEILLKQRGCP